MENNSEIIATAIRKNRLKLGFWGVLGYYYNIFCISILLSFLVHSNAMANENMDRGEQKNTEIFTAKMWSFSYAIPRKDWKESWSMEHFQPMELFGGCVNEAGSEGWRNKAYEFRQSAGYIYTPIEYPHQLKPTASFDIIFRPDGICEYKWETGYSDASRLGSVTQMGRWEMTGDTLILYHNPSLPPIVEGEHIVTNDVLTHKCIGRYCFVEYPYSAYGSDTCMIITTLGYEAM